MSEKVKKGYKKWLDLGTKIDEAEAKVKSLKKDRVLAAETLASSLADGQLLQTSNGLVKVRGTRGGMSCVSYSGAAGPAGAVDVRDVG
jgi:hypothetical protein